MPLSAHGNLQRVSRRSHVHGWRPRRGVVQGDGLRTAHPRAIPESGFVLTAPPTDGAPSSLIGGGAAVRLRGVLDTSFVCPGVLSLSSLVRRSGAALTFPPGTSKALFLENPTVAKKSCEAQLYEPSAVIHRLSLNPHGHRSRTF